MPRHFLGLLLSVYALGFCPSEAHASPVVLWSGDSSCLDGASLSQTLSKALIELAESQGLTLKTSLAKDSRSWIVSLRLVQHERILGQREVAVESGDCSVLTEHIVLIATLMLETAVLPPPTPLAPAPAPAPAPAVIPPAQIEYRQDALDSTPFESHASQQPQWSISLATLREERRMPAASVGVKATVHWQVHQRVRVDAGVFAHPSTSTPLQIPELELRWRGGQSAACLKLFGSARVVGWICSGVLMGQMRARGVGFSRNQVQHELLVDVTSGMQVRWPLLGPVFVELGAQARVALRRARFGYENQGGDFQSLFSPQAVSYVGKFAVGVHLF